MHQIKLQESDNEIKGNGKVIKSLEIREILLKGTTRKTIKQEGRLLNFLRPLITTVLQLMKSGLTLLAKSALLPLGLSSGMSAADEAIQKKQNSWIRKFTINNFKWRNGRFNENS